MGTIKTVKELVMKEVLGGLFLGVCLMLPVVLWAFGYLG